MYVLVTLERAVAVWTDLEVPPLKAERGFLEQHGARDVAKRRASGFLIFQHVDRVPAVGGAGGLESPPRRFGLCRLAHRASALSTAWTKLRLRSRSSSPATSKLPPISSITSVP